MNKQEEQPSCDKQGEPVAWDGDCVLGYCGSPAGCEASMCCRADTTPQQRTTEPKRQWVGLSYEEAEEIYRCIHGYDAPRRISEAIEAKLKEKNT